MRQHHRIAICLIAALMGSACSTRPRQFSAAVRPVETTLAAQNNQAAQFADCDRMVRSGRKSGFASALAQGAAGGAGLLAGAAGVAASGTVGIGATTGGAVLSAAIPFVGLAAGFGVNRLIRSGRERKYKAGMTTCLHELGYNVVTWSRAPKKQSGTATLQAEPAPAPTEIEPVATASSG